MKKILIVDENSDFRKYTKNNLELRGYEVIEASNAKEGLDKAVKNTLDLVLMDMWLPSKRLGLNTARTLRENDKTKNVPILFVTGSTQDEETREITRMTRCGFITKPFEMRVLEQKIEQCIK